MTFFSHIFTKGVFMQEKSQSQKLAEFRFSIIGNLLSSPPERGDGIQAFKMLAQKEWIHPIKKHPVCYHWHTIEQWYYKARQEKLSSLDALRPKERTDKGQSRVLSEEVKKIIIERYSNTIYVK